MSDVRFPNETEEYRRARAALLTDERELRRITERVAERRRRLPLGGEVPDDYEFEETAAADKDVAYVVPRRMSSLFEGGHDTLVIYSFMYGPDMKRPCPLCTSILDGLDGQAPHITQRANLAVVAKSPIARIQAFAHERGWRNLHLLSSARNTYNRDYHGEDAQGEQLPMANVFVRRDGRIHHFWSSELFHDPPDPSQDPRHVDAIWPLWNVLDWTPEGRGTFHPRLEYPTAVTIPLL